MAREIAVERVVEDYDYVSDLVVLKVDSKYLAILVPREDSYAACALDKDSDAANPVGLNLVCPGHYT
jgi:hypothetical protein